MKHRVNILLALTAALAGGILLFSPPLRAADPPALFCPNGQTVFIEGRTAPHEAVLLYLRGRPVGGGLADGAGRFRMPLRPQERPGVYPVEVRLRANQALVATYTCYVDVAFDAAPSQTPTFEGGPPAPTPRAPASATATLATATLATATARPTATAGAAATTQPTPRAATAQPTSTTAPTAAAGSTPVPSPTAVPANVIQIDDIALLDPEVPDEPEYVQISNVGTSPISLVGWRLVNVTRAAEVQPYIFPAFEIGSGVTIAVFSEVGDNDLELGDFYWDQSITIWRVGDRAELRDTQGRVVAEFTIPNQ